ncbi:SEL1-like repeat protein [Clostridiaceae bacterium Marseille-Q4143]|nr:SEL1-like repeat protein [Clostridiaceae bacterium Marseille-Q4143]
MSEKYKNKFIVNLVLVVFSFIIGPVLHIPVLALNIVAFLVIVFSPFTLIYYIIRYLQELSYEPNREWSLKSIRKEANEIKIGNKCTSEGASEYEMGENYYYGRNGKNKDLDKAMTYYLKASKLGNLDAIYSIGYIEYHQSEKHDAKKTFNYFFEAAYRGHVAAQRYLGYCYWHGEGTEENIRKALIWFYKAAERGDAESMNMCAILFDEKERSKDAVYYYKKAVSNGNVCALYGLAMHYYYGEGVNKNIFYAEEYLKKFRIAISKGASENVPQKVKELAANLENEIQREKRYK